MSAVAARDDAPDPFLSERLTLALQGLARLASRDDAPAMLEIYPEALWALFSLLADEAERVHAGIAPA